MLPTYFFGTDYGLPMKPFFIEIPKFWVWADNLGRFGCSKTEKDVLKQERMF